MSLAPSYPQFRPRNFNPALVNSGPVPLNTYGANGMYRPAPTGNATMSPPESTGNTSATVPMSGANTAWPTGGAPLLNRTSRVGPVIATQPIAPGTNTLGRNSTYNDQNNYAGGLNKIDAANQVANGPLPTINRIGDANNPFSEQQSRAVWSGINDKLPGEENRVAREHEFFTTMAKYGVNGPALLDQWETTEGAPQTSFINGYTTSPGRPISDAPIPAGAFGTNYATPGYSTGAHTGKTADGRAVLVDANGRQVGPDLGQQSPSPQIRTPIMGPQRGNTPLASEFLLGPTNQSQANGATTRAGPTTPPVTSSAMQNTVGLGQLQQIRDQGQSPVDDATRSRVRDTQANALRNAGQAQINYTPPGAREIFNAQNQNIQSAIQQPVAVAQAKGGAIAAGRAQSGPEKALDAAKFKAQQDQNLTAHQYVGHVRAMTSDLIKGGMAPDVAAKTANDTLKDWDPRKTANPAPGTPYTDPTMGISQPPPRSMGAVDGSTANQAVDAAGGDLGQAERGLQQRGFKMQPGDQTHLGFIYRKGPDGQYHKVGPAPQGQ